MSAAADQLEALAQPFRGDYLSWEAIEVQLHTADITGHHQTLTGDRLTAEHTVPLTPLAPLDTNLRHLRVPATDQVTPIDFQGVDHDLVTVTEAAVRSSGESLRSAHDLEA